MCPYYLQFSSKKNKGTERLSNLTEVIQLVSIRDQIQALEVWVLSLVTAYTASSFKTSQIKLEGIQ